MVFIDFIKASLKKGGGIIATKDWSIKKELFH